MKYGEEAVYALLDLLNGMGVPYMLVGSFSSNAYGQARATNDADFVVELSAGMRRELFDSLPPEFSIDDQASFETITGHQRQIIQIPSIPFEIELFDLSDEPFDASRFNRRLRTKIGDRTVWLPTAEDVVVQKLRWWHLGKREKDKWDVIGILQVRGSKLDWEYINRWCVQLGLDAKLSEARAAADCT